MQDHWHRVSRAAACALMTLSLATIVRAEEPNAVFIMRRDGGQVRQVAKVDELACHSYPRWSHDGKQLAFEVLTVGTKTRKVYSINADGTGLRELGPHAMPDWSPDDKQWVVQHFLGGNAPPEVFVHNVDGQGQELVAHGRSPRWSPEGDKLALSDQTMLRTVDLATGAEVLLFAEPVAEIFSGFDWSPDGKQLAVVIRRQPNAQRELLIVDARGAKFEHRVRLKSNAGGAVAWSPDGKQLVLSTNNTIHILEIQGTKPAQPIPGQIGKNTSPAWSPDGQSIVFISDRK